MARVREFDTDAAAEAAMGAFRRKGYEGTSVQDLVDATGIGRGSLYAAFGSKEGLYHAALGCYRERYMVPLVEALQGGAPARELIRDIMIDMVDQVIEESKREACLIISATMERVPHDPEVAAQLRETISSLEDTLTELIGEAQANGGIAADRTARDLARYLVMTMQGLRVMGAIQGDRKSLTAAVEVALGCLG
ncbi:TetR/AcrR family transcriptional regulator [Microbispora rosea]|uniref:TetR/AcrR family transcriptional regulator n=1 Tax=Microbispora rosea TaxID=58117 RepID=UPI003449C2F4